jgi:Mg-chelatase subunit ChlI
LFHSCCCCCCCSLQLPFLECEHSTHSSFKTIRLLRCRAIAQAVVRSLTLWQGPPGTGKTRTLLALVEVLVKTALAEVGVICHVITLLHCC